MLILKAEIREGVLGWGSGRAAINQEAGGGVWGG